MNTLAKRGDLEPIAAYDVTDGSYRYEDHGELREWAAGQGIDVNNTYRIEVHLFDCLFARVYGYELDGHGRRYLDPDTDDAARRVYDQPVSSMPPVEPFAPSTQ